VKRAHTNLIVWRIVHDDFVVDIDCHTRLPCARASPPTE